MLQGTTGSGKTLVYFNLIKNKIKQNKQALILLPEIGLTGEFEKKFLDFFGFKPAIWHSSVTPKNKKIIWNGLSNGNIKAIIGARSSLFLPFKNLGIVIVDEEHDQSFIKDWSCSSSTITIPKFLKGKKRDDLAPIIALIFPLLKPFHMIFLFFGVTLECHIAGLKPKKSKNFFSNSPVKPISGSSISACLFCLILFLIRLK